MSSIAIEKVLEVRHWNDTLFSFKATRDPSFRFENGHFVMLGLPINGKPLLRAYSIVSANYEDHLEFLSIKVQDGALTSHLQHLKPGDEILVGRKPTGTLVTSDLKDGKRLYLVGTGTGLAPFMSIIRDPETYERFDQVILIHGVRLVSELAYSDYIRDELPKNEFFGEEVTAKLLYYPTVTREPYVNRGRVNEVIDSGRMAADLGIAQIDPSQDRFMLCGSPSMLTDFCTMLDARGFIVSPRRGEPGDYVIERAFVEK
jgi:ferredoxin/flavodoxin---NADP+ reductase